MNIPFVFALKFSNLVGKNGINLPLPEQELLKLANNDTSQMKLLPQLFVVEIVSINTLCNLKGFEKLFTGQALIVLKNPLENKTDGMF